MVLFHVVPATRQILHLTRNCKEAGPRENTNVVILEGLSSPKNAFANTLLGVLLDGCEDEFWLKLSMLRGCP